MDELVHGHELDGGDAEAEQVLDDRRLRQAEVGAPLVGREVGVTGGEALHVQLVHDRLVPRGARRPVVHPVEVRVGDDAFGHARGAVAVVGRIGVAAHRVWVHGGVPSHLALDRLGVRVEQQLRRIAAMAGVRCPRSVDAVAVALPGFDVGHVRMPDVAVDLGERDTLLVAVGVEQAQLDAFGDLGEDREVGADAVVGRAEGVRPPRPQVHRLPTLSHSGRRYPPTRSSSRGRDRSMASRSRGSSTGPQRPPP